MQKVLIVEDHPDMRDVLSRQIELMGLSPLAAKDGREAVELALKEKPELILMDIMLPQMDGREATRLIRANPETKNIPILAATCQFREEDLKTILEAGCNDFLVKPFSFKDLKGKVLAFLAAPREAVT